jgi:hypothetical protein
LGAATALSAFAAEGPVIDMRMLADGSIEIEGERIAAPDAQEAKLREIGARRPQPSLRLIPNPGIGYEAVVRILVIVQKVNLDIGMRGSVASP